MSVMIAKSKCWRLMWLGMMLLFLVAITIALTGCGTMVPHENKNVATATDSQKTAQNAQVSMVKEAATTPPMDVQSSGTGNVVNVSISSAPIAKTVLSNAVVTSVDAGTAVKQTDELSIPLGVKLTLLGIGILVAIGAIVWGIKILSNNSAAAKAAFAAADNGIAAMIAHIETQQAITTDAGQLLHLATLKAAAEKQRGKLATTKKT